MGQARRRRSSGGVCCFGARNFSIRRNRKSDFQARPTPSPGGACIHRKVTPNGRKASLRLPQPTPPCQAGPVTSCAALRRAAFPFRADFTIRSAASIAGYRFPSSPLPFSLSAFGQRPSNGCSAVHGSIGLLRLPFHIAAVQRPKQLRGAILFPGLSPVLSARPARNLVSATD